MHEPENGSSLSEDRQVDGDDASRIRRDLALGHQTAAVCTTQRSSLPGIRL